jgi:hypothetical protein
MYISPLSYGLCISIYFLYYRSEEVNCVYMLNQTVSLSRSLQLREQSDDLKKVEYINTIHTHGRVYEYKELRVPV